MATMPPIAIIQRFTPAEGHNVEIHISTSYDNKEPSVTFSVSSSGPILQEAVIVDPLGSPVFGFLASKSTHVKLAFGRPVNLDPRQDLFLRVRFAGAEAYMQGDVPFRMRNQRITSKKRLLERKAALLEAMQAVHWQPHGLKKKSQTTLETFMDLHLQLRSHKLRLPDAQREIIASVVDTITREQASHSHAAPGVVAHAQLTTSHTFTDTPGSTLQAAITLAGVSNAVHTAKPKAKRRKNMDGSGNNGDSAGITLLHNAANIAQRTARLDTAALPNYPELLPVMAQPGGGNLCATRYQDADGRWWCLTVVVGKDVEPRLPAMPNLPSGPNAHVVDQRSVLGTVLSPAHTAVLTGPGPPIVGPHVPSTQPLQMMSQLSGRRAKSLVFPTQGLLGRPGDPAHMGGTPGGLVQPNPALILGAELSHTSNVGYPFPSTSTSAGATSTPTTLVTTAPLSMSAVPSVSIPSAPDAPAIPQTTLPTAGQANGNPVTVPSPAQTGAAIGPAEDEFRLPPNVMIASATPISHTTNTANITVPGSSHLTHIPFLGSVTQSQPLSSFYPAASSAYFAPPSSASYLNTLPMVSLPMTSFAPASSTQPRLSLDTSGLLAVNMNYPVASTVITAPDTSMPQTSAVTMIPVPLTATSVTLSTDMPMQQSLQLHNPPMSQSSPSLSSLQPPTATASIAQPPSNHPTMSQGAPTEPIMGMPPGLPFQQPPTAAMATQSPGAPVPQMDMESTVSIGGADRYASLSSMQASNPAPPPQ